MARRKTVAVVLALAPDENKFKDAEIVQKRWSRKMTADQIKKLAAEFHEFLTANANWRSCPSICRATGGAATSNWRLPPK